MNLEPVPYEKFAETEYGLIAPNGQLFACGYTDHCSLADRLVQAETIQRNYNKGDHHGAVHVSGRTFDYIEKGLKNPEGMYGKHLQVTQRQLNTMLDYTLAQGMQFDFSKLEVI